MEQGLRPSGHECTVTQYLPLDAVPRGQGAVTYNGAYWILGRPVFVIKRMVRAANAPVPPPVDREPHAKIIKVVAEPFEVETYGPSSKKGNQRDSEEVKVIFRRRGGAVAEADKVIEINNLEIHDAARLYRQDITGNFSVVYPMDSEANKRLKRQLAPGEALAGVEVRLDEKLKTTGRLKLRGTLSVDNNWPMPFELDLPPRPAATAKK